MAGLLGELGGLSNKQELQENIASEQIDGLDVIPDSPNHATIKSHKPSDSGDGQAGHMGKTEAAGGTTEQTHGTSAKFEGETGGSNPKSNKADGNNTKFEGKAEGATQGENAKFEGKTEGKSVKPGGATANAKFEGTID